jgi:hypothetical protein
LVQPEEYLNTQVYKIGRSGNYKERLKDYGKKVITYGVVAIANQKHIEDLLKIEFNDKFDLYRGKEYFRGDINDMKDTFLNLVMVEDKKYRGLSLIELYKKLHRSCPYCWESFEFGAVVVKHLQLFSCKNRSEGLGEEACNNCGEEFDNDKNGWLKHLRHLQLGECMGRNEMVEIPQDIVELQKRYKQLLNTISNRKFL